MTTGLTPMAAVVSGLVLLLAVHVVLLWRLSRAARETANDATARVALLTAALDLLTDTTEEGFVSVAAELERLGARPLPGSSTRRATTRRIAAAARNGRPVGDIADAESLSESEVRLHLGIEAASEQAAPRDALLASKPQADVLSDLERRMKTLAKSRRVRGAPHVALRV